MPLTERQQMALLLEMTAKEFQEQEDSKDKGKKSGESSSSKRLGPSSKRDLQKINKRNKRGETQLHLASIKGDVDGVKGLIKKGADVNMTDYAGKWISLKSSFSKNHSIMFYFYYAASYQVTQKSDPVPSITERN